MCIGFDSKLDFIPPPILFGLLLCPWTWNIFFFFWWDSTFSCQWLFSNELQFWSSHRRRWGHVLLLCHLSSKSQHYSYTKIRQHYKKENHRQVSLMNLDTKFFNKVLANDLLLLVYRNAKKISPYEFCIKWLYWVYW